MSTNINDRIALPPKDASAWGGVKRARRPSRCKKRCFSVRLEIFPYECHFVLHVVSALPVTKGDSQKEVPHGHRSNSTHQLNQPEVFH